MLTDDVTYNGSMYDVDRLKAKPAFRRTSTEQRLAGTDANERSTSPARQPLERERD